MSKKKVIRSGPAPKEAQMLRKEGARAAQEGLHNNHNPYRCKNPWHTAWKYGWIEAYKEVFIDRIKSLKVPLEPHKLALLELNEWTYEGFTPKFVHLLTDMGFSNRQAEEFRVECTKLLKRVNEILLGSKEGLPRGLNMDNRGDFGS